MKSLTMWNRLPMLRHELDRVFANFDDELLGTSSLAEWTPALDVFEAENEFVVKAECPGLEAKDLRVRMTNDALTIEGEKKAEAERKSDRMYRRERNYGAFSREIRFPTPTDGAKVKAHLANGILTLNVPKAAAAKASDIPVHVG